MGIGECYNCGACMNIDLMHRTPEGSLLCPECFRKYMMPDSCSNDDDNECPYCVGTGKDARGVDGGCPYCNGTGVKSNY